MCIRKSEHSTAWCGCGSQNTSQGVAFVNVNGYLDIHLNEFLIGHFIKYDIMHLKIGYCVLCTPIYRLTERKNISMYKTVHAELLNLVGKYSSLIFYYEKH